MRTIDAAIRALTVGEPILVTDRDGRGTCELVVPAARTTAAQITMMVRVSSGLVYAPMTSARVEELHLLPMVPFKAEPGQWALTVSVDLVEGTTTGISANDRTKTLQGLASSTCGPHEFARPGHVFPVLVEPHGCLANPASPEAAVDLLIETALPPVAAMATVVHDDGSLLRPAQSAAWASARRIPTIDVAEVVAHRRQHASGATNGDAHPSAARDQQPPSRSGRFLLAAAVLRQEGITEVVLEDASPEVAETLAAAGLHVRGAEPTDAPAVSTVVSPRARREAALAGAQQ